MTNYSIYLIDDEKVSREGVALALSKHYQVQAFETAEDAMEFMVAGATAVQVGTANFVNPRASEEVVEGISDYVIRKKLKSVRELINSLQLG